MLIQCCQFCGDPRCIDASCLCDTCDNLKKVCGKNCANKTGPKRTAIPTKAMGCNTCRINTLDIKELNERNKAYEKETEKLRETIKKNAVDSKTQSTERTTLLTDIKRLKKENTKLKENTVLMEEEITRLNQNTLRMEEEMVILSEELKRKRLDEENITLPNVQEEMKTKECKVCMNIKPLASFRTREKRKNKEGNSTEYWVIRSTCHSCKTKKGRDAKKAKVCK